MVKQALKKKLIPMQDRVIAQKLEQKETINGIILPESAKEKQEIAKVVAVGPGKKNSDGKKIEIGVKVGDVILAEKYAGQEITLDGEDYFIVKADDIIAIVEE
jgi:chaperonin GroES